MKKTNNKILIGSISKYLDKKTILGNTVKSDSIVLLDILLSNYEYALSQLEAGNVRYNSIVQNIADKIDKLKYHCPEICLYKNKLVYFSNNTPPEINKNLIRIPLSTDLYDVQKNEVIKDYFDRENNGISQVVIINSSDNLEFLIDNQPVIENNIYSPGINSFKVKHKFEEEKQFIIVNTGNCTPVIITVDKQILEENKNKNILFDIQNNKIQFQSLVNNLEELPNDTIIYIHIDTSSMAVPDQQTIQELALEWWRNFKAENPQFEGSLLINTVANNIIGNNPIAGRESAGKINAPNSFPTTSVEEWLGNPIEALERNAYKEGITNFPTEEDFLNYITNKSVVVLTFVDEADGKYHKCIPGTFQQTSVTQPSPRYITDYNNFVFKIRPKLRFFKGVLYPIIRVNTACNDSFLLHSLAAIEGKNLTPQEINTQLGNDVVTSYGSNMQSKFYTPLENNPYRVLNKLKENGWQGNFTKTSPASEVLTSEQFSNELNTILTDVSSVEVTTIVTEEFDIENFGSSITDNINIKVRDNHENNPLFSNIAQIDFNFFATCEKTGECISQNSININHKSNYIFSENDFSLSSENDKIKITSVNIPSGQLKYDNLVLDSSKLPLVIKKENLSKLKYESNSIIQEEYRVSFTYQVSKKDSVNYCTGGNSINITKLENPNKPATIIIAPLSLVAQTPSEIFNNKILNATISYNGTGGYTQFWTLVSGPTDVVLTNPNDVDLIVSNLKQTNNYTFKLTVITNEDNFVTTQDITVPVTLANQAPTVNAGTDQSNTELDIPNSSINLIATESDFENNIVSRQWTQVSGPSTATISNPNNLSTSVNNLVEGVYIFRITVTDGGNLSASDDVQVSMIQQNRPPTVNVQDSATLQLPNSNSLGVSISTSDPDGDSLTKVWTQISGPSSATINQSINNFSNLIAGVYVFRITVTDPEGLSAFDEITITVNPPINTAPIVSDSNTNLPAAFNNEINLTLTTSEFTNNFQDAENDSYKKTQITQLPSQGELLFNNNPVTSNFEFDLSQVSNLTYKLQNVKSESDGTFVYTENINTRIQQLITDGYIQQSYSNGVYVFNKLSQNLIDSGVDGTFDSLPGINTTDSNNATAFNSNVTGAGWQNGFGSADSVLPNPNDDGSNSTPTRPGIGCPPSPQGGVYAGAISIGTENGEEFFTQIPTVAGGIYRVTFYQTFAGDNVTTYPLNSSIPWRVTLGTQELLSTPNPWLGFQNQVWTEEVLEFTATTTSQTTKLSFKAGSPNGATNDSTRHGYLGCDHVRIQQVLQGTTDTVTLTGTQLTNQTIKFKTSDNGAGELYSNEQTLTLNS